MSGLRSQTSRPIRTSRPTRKHPAWQPKNQAFKPGLPWQDRHHVVPSISNKHAPKNNRWYFDRLGAVSWKRGEFNDIVSFQAHTCDLEDHRENIRRTFVQFPQYVPPICRGKSSRGRRPGSKHSDSQDRVDTLSLTQESSSSQTVLAEAGTQTEFQSENDIENDIIAFCQNRDVQHSLRQTRLSDVMPEVPVDPSHDDRPENQAQLWAAAKKQLGVEAESVPIKLLMEWCRVKRTHVVSVWRRLDADMSMTLQKQEFIQGLKAFGYPENLDALWVSLDKDHTGNISFLEFAPEPGLDLARFKFWVEDHFGDMHTFFSHLDSDHNGKLTFNEFRAACNVEGMPERLQESIRTLFLLCDDPDDVTSKGTITEEELKFLVVWKCPVYLRETPDVMARMQFQDELLSLHDRNPLMAWRVALDRDGSMRVGFSEFAATCRDLTRKGFKAADPPAGIPALYCAFDLNRSGWFTLRDWDKETHTLLEQFHNFCKEKHGKASLFVRSLDMDGSGITSGQFSRAIADLDMDFDDRHMLFDGLSMGKNKRQSIMRSKANKKMYVQDVIFLDSWHPEQEMREEIAWEKKILKRMSTYVRTSLVPREEDGSLTARKSQVDGFARRQSRPSIFG